MNELKLFSGTANPELAQKIADKLGVEVGELTIRRFSDGEVHARAGQSVRGCDAFIVQSCQTPVNEHLMELLVIIDSFRRASVRRVTVVMPYFCYSRQDKKLKPREPVTAKLVANLLTTAGANRVLTMDLHSGQIMGFFDIPVDHLYSGPIIADHIKNNIPLDNAVVVSPDVGGVTRARALAEVLGTPIAIIVKRRPEPNKAEVIELIGDVSGKTAIMFDDLIDTGGSIIGGADALLERGASEVYAACTHGLLSGDAIQRLAVSAIKKLIVTDTIPMPQGGDGKIAVVSVAGLLADAIGRIHSECSISEIFDKVWKARS
ncbi:MAG: ribose-phosphate pyrophosphokinase [Armatimonadetes bacterium]|nr:ribose-phosphate pyrophosphokinase [Armatimonadota bacterium]